jgi:hypothetical protein
MTFQQRINIVVNFIGYGNPESPLWIFGREEGSGWPCDDEIIQNFDEQFDIEGLFEKNYMTGTYGNYNRLIQKIKPDLWNSRNFFVGNSLPFGRKGDNITSEESKYFSFQGLSYSEIIEIIKTDRLDGLYNFFLNHNWETRIILFCCGLEYYEVLQALIQRLYPNIPEPFYKPKPGLNYQVDKVTNKIFILRHLSPRFCKPDCLNQIAEFIQEYLVQS